MSPATDIDFLEPYIAAARRSWNKSKPYKPNLALRILFGMGRRIQEGTCHVVLPDGQVHHLTGVKKPAAVTAVCIVHNDRFAWKLLVRGSLGFCESYLDNDWSSPDVTKLFSLALDNERALHEMIDGHNWWRTIEGLFNKFKGNTRRGSQRNIAQHYDLGNVFYKKWLDGSMTYSAGLFDENQSGNDDLFRAQLKKYENIAKMANLQPHHKVLEIGCGWGGFAEYAAREIGCHVTGLTISREQYDYAQQRIAEAGLRDKVDIQLCDYRDSDGLFDRVISIEMFEAVGEKYWPLFFKTVGDRLCPGGIAAMQVITIAERYLATYRRGADYIQKYIFPGGLLPTFTQLRDQVGEACLEWQEEHLFGHHYARTLREWHQRFTDAWPQINSSGFDERFRRMWEQYLCYCEAGFQTGTVNVCQVSFVKPVRASG